MSTAARTLSDPNDPALRTVGSSFSKSPFQLSAAAYTAALVDLSVRIWLELERLADLCHQSCISDEHSTLCLKAETLRLDLLLLSDSCNSEVWRSMLDYAQRESLSTMVIDVLHAIAFMPDALTRGAIEHAQDRVFDEVLAQYDTVISGETISCMGVNAHLSPAFADVDCTCGIP